MIEKIRMLGERQFWTPQVSAAALCTDPNKCERKRYGIPGMSDDS